MVADGKCGCEKKENEEICRVHFYFLKVRFYYYEKN
jgi:hypothetical protein